MNKKTLVYVLSLFIVAGTVGAISTSAHFSAGSGQAAWGKLFSSEEIEVKIAEKVADGTLTQEQADQKLEWMADKRDRHDEHVAEFAEFLGLSVEELEVQIDAGNNPREIAEAQGISEEAMQEYHKTQMTEHMSERLQSMVDAGKLTQEQADEKLESIESGEWRGRMHKGFGKRGGMHQD